MAECEFLVTGGAGFIGSNIVTTLVGEGRSVRVLDDLSTGRLANLDGVRDRIDLIQGDIRDPATAARAAKGARFVLHLGAMPSVIRSVEDPATANDVNIRGTLNMLLAARDAGVERFVFSSSSSVYGESPTLPKREDMVPMPLSPYALHKLAGEHYCRMFHSLYGLKTFSLRYFNVFGPRQNPKSHYAAVIPLFIEALRTGGQIRIFGDGGQTRDFTFVEDIVRANLACCQAGEQAAGGVYNAAKGSRISVLELARLLMKISGRTVEIAYLPARAGEVRDSEADPALARASLGWEVRVPLEEGLRRTVEWFFRSASA